MTVLSITFTWPDRGSTISATTITAKHNFVKFVCHRPITMRCHLGFGETGNSDIRSADPENPTVEPNMKWIG